MTFTIGRPNISVTLRYREIGVGAATSTIINNTDVRLDWNAISNVDWLHPPLGGSLPARGSSGISINVNSHRRLSVGTHVGTVTITAGGQSRNITVTATITARPDDITPPPIISPPPPPANIYITLSINVHARVTFTDVATDRDTVFEGIRFKTFTLPRPITVYTIIVEAEGYISQIIKNVNTTSRHNVTLIKRPIAPPPIAPPAQHLITLNINTHANVSITREKDGRLISRFENTRVITTNVPADRYNFVIHQTGFITQRFTETIYRNQTFNITLIREKEPPITPPPRRKERVFRLSLILLGQVHRLQPMIPQIQRIANPIFTAAGFTIRQVFIRDRRLIIEVIK